MALWWVGWLVGTDWFYLVVYVCLRLFGFDYLGFPASDFGFGGVVLASLWQVGGWTVALFSGRGWFCLGAMVLGWVVWFLFGSCCVFADFGLWISCGFACFDFVCLGVAVTVGVCYMFAVVWCCFLFWMGCSLVALGLVLGMLVIVLGCCLLIVVLRLYFVVRCLRGLFGVLSFCVLFIDCLHCCGALVLVLVVVVDFGLR